MHHTDLIYRREMVGWTRRQFATILGRDYQTIARWENGVTEMPSWLYDWLEYMDSELVCGRSPGPIPKRFKDIEEILYPARKAVRRPRRPNGVNRDMLEKRAAHVKRLKARVQRSNHEWRTRHDITKT